VHVRGQLPIARKEFVEVNKKKPLSVVHEGGQLPICSTKRVGRSRRSQKKTKERFRIHPG